MISDAPHYLELEMSRDLVQVVGELHLFFALNFTSQFLGETHLDIWMGTLNIRS
jgi:hypothetical protein